MADMFQTYDNLSDNYIPSNINIPTGDPSKLVSNVIDKPYEEYDENGNLIGYWWNYGDTRTLEFTIDGEVVIDGIDTGSYVDASDFLEDKQITITIYNFRSEAIKTQIFAGSTSIEMPIDFELSNIMVPGIYTCSLTIWNNETYNQTFFLREDVRLTVK